MLDLIIVGFSLLMAIWGYAQGLIVGALSLAGFVGGAVLGSRLGPLLLEEGNRSPWAPLVALGAAVVVGGVLAALLEGLGFRLRRALGGSLGFLDGLGGALLIGCIGLGLAWLGGAAAVSAPAATSLAQEVQRSAIIRALNGALPPSGPVLGIIARFDPFPSIAGPAPEVAAPNSRIARDRDVRRAGGSVVRVLGTACGYGVQGSGWVAGDGVVVTNAHVVAGQQDTTVQVRGRGTRHAAQAIWMDPRNDLALLAVPGIRDVPALPLRVNAPPGTSAAILGFPRNGPFDVRAARLGRTSEILSQDSYGRGPVRRRVTSLRGRVRSGNSGGPVVDGRGRVLATVFASTEGRERAGYGVPDSVVAQALEAATGPVDTGPCAR